MVYQTYALTVLKIYSLNYFSVINSIYASSLQSYVFDGSKTLESGSNSSQCAALEQLSSKPTCGPKVSKSCLMTVRPVLKVRFFLIPVSFSALPNNICGAKSSQKYYFEMRAFAQRPNLKRNCFGARFSLSNKFKPASLSSWEDDRLPLAFQSG